MQRKSIQTELIIKLFEKYLWNKLQNKIIYYPYKHETYFPTFINEILKIVNSKTAQFVCYLPDYLLIYSKTKINSKDPVFLLDYKTITTPKYTLQDKQWDYGQVDADAWDNYLSLYKNGINILILIYCSYHSRPFLLDFPVEPDSERKQVLHTTKGSGTDYYKTFLQESYGF